MAMAINFITILFFLPLLAINVNAQGPVIYDITKYGAKPGADISQAIRPLSSFKSKEPCKPILIPVNCRINKGNGLLSIMSIISPFLVVEFFDGQGQQAWKQNDCHKNRNCAKLPMNLSFNFINNSIIQDVTTKDSKNFHVNCISSHNVTFRRFTISAPGDSPNTDGIHLGRDTMINIVDSIIKTGDDCISIGDETKELHIQNVTCGPGHGISVGSLGGYAEEKDVQGIYVKNCTFIGTQNGVRVKTWPSAPATLTVSDLHFEDLIMDNVSSPIIIDQEYCPHNLCKKDRPSSIKITNVSIKNVRGTTNSAEAVTFICSGLKPCENVEVGDIDLTYTGNQGPITPNAPMSNPNLSASRIHQCVPLLPNPLNQFIAHLFHILFS
ncbi:UNVERIFIED_CONTAM: Polygalacturonase [Sesamum radiatum]|uniref:Polygalacturonase n=1 Tax=Sesamum radiatum TaxID=300843 RepID=A0AAW2VNQ7_SESRA